MKEAILESNSCPGVEVVVQTLISCPTPQLCYKRPVSSRISMVNGKIVTFNCWNLTLDITEGDPVTTCNRTNWKELPDECIIWPLIVNP